MEVAEILDKVQGWGPYALVLYLELRLLPVLATEAGWLRATALRSGVTPEEAAAARPPQAVACFDPTSAQHRLMRSYDHADRLFTPMSAGHHACDFRASCPLLA